MEIKIVDEIGKVESRGKGNFEWRIDNFFALSKHKDSFYFGPDFFYLDSRWYLEILPNEGDTNEWIGLFLCRKRGPPKTVKFIIGFKKVNETVEALCKEECHTFPIDTPIGKRKFLKRCELLERQFVLDSSGTVAITCTMRSHEQNSMKDSQFERLWNLSRSFKKAFDEGEDTDVLLKLKTREVRAHRFVLNARSTVFKKMLEIDMSESRSGVIELPDENEDAFDVFLSYMYCGDPENIDSKNVCEVYKIAHKYDLPELKKLCCVFINNNMSADLVCDVILIAYLYEETELEECAKDYVAENVTQVVELEKWKELKREESVLVSELLERIMVENSLKRRSKKFKKDADLPNDTIIVNGSRVNGRKLFFDPVRNLVY